MLLCVIIMIEGYLVKYGDYLWMVKGCEHFDEYIIAYPRYDVSKGIKIKSLDEALSIATKLGVAKYNECLKMKIPLLSRAKIEYVLDPFNKEHWPRLPKKIMKLLNQLDLINSNDVGLTGSYLASTIIKNLKPRDLDLIIKDKSTGIRLYELLKYLRSKGISKPMNIIEDFEGGDQRTRLKLLRYRVLEGILDDIIYSIRIVSCKESRKPHCIEKVNLLNDEIIIIEQISPFIMPYTYLGKSKVLGEVVIRSLRMRYSEIPIGTKLLVNSCRVEYYENGTLNVCLDNRECIVKIP